MEPKLISGTWNAKQALISLMETDPWFGLAIIYLLDGEQWDAIQSQAVFLTINDAIRRIALRVRGGRNNRVADWPVEVSDEILNRLLTRPFLRSYQHKKGRPRSFMLGVAKRLALSVWSSRRYAGAKKQENRAETTTALPTWQSSGEHSVAAIEIERSSSKNVDPATKASDADLLSLIWRLISELPPKQRDAVTRWYFNIENETGVTPAERQKESVRRCHGLASIRQQLRQMGLIEQ